MPTILVTNDDGIQSPALAVLAQHLRSLGTLYVIAPEHNWSAAGHTKTMHKPLRVTPGQLTDGAPAMACSGSPSDCVALALLGVMDIRPDLVVSGINLGANVGQDLTYSGTVAAAMEGVIGGVSSLAISLDADSCAHAETAAAFATRLARRVIEDCADAPYLLNVNVPDLAIEEVAGVRVTRLGRRIYRDALVTRHDPRGREYHWIGGNPPDGVAEEGTDIGALVAGMISVTPVRLDLTDYGRMADLEGWDLAP